MVIEYIGYVDVAVVRKKKFRLNLLEMVPQHNVQVVIVLFDRPRMDLQKGIVNLLNTTFGIR